MTIHALVPRCAEPQERCFELFRMQNSQNFPTLCPWTPLGKAYSPSAPPSKTPQLQNGFSLHNTCKKTSTPTSPSPPPKKKITGYSTDDISEMF